MASGWTVATTFTARGNLGRELRNLRGEFGSLGRAAGRAKRFVGGLMTGAAIGGAAALAFGVREVKNEYIDLDQAVTNAAAKWGDSFNRGTQGFNDLQEAAKQVGLTTEHRSAQAATGLNFLAMAGFTAEEALKLLPGVANLATAANIDFAQSTDIASDSLGAFGMATGTSEQKAAGFQKIMEQVAMTTNKTNTDILQWFEAVKQGAPTFTTAGQTLATFNTAVGLLANNGIKAEKAGTSLRGAMATLSKTSGKSAATLRKLGVTVRDDNGNFKDFAEILGDLNKATTDLGTAEKTGVLERIFGKRQMSQMAILMKEGEARFRSLRTEIENSAGADVQLASKMRKSIANSFKLVQSALVGKGIDIVQELFGGDDPAEALTNLAKAIQDFDTGPMVDALRDALRVLRETGRWLYDNREMLMALGKAFIAFKIGSFVTDFGRGVTAMLGFGQTSAAVSKGVSGDFSRMGRNIRGALGLVGALVAMYETLNFAVGGVEEAQKARLENVRQREAYDRQLKRADISGWTEKGVRRSRDIAAGELKKKQKEVFWSDRDLEIQKELQRQIRDFDNELKRRQVEQREIVFPWEAGAVAGVSSEMLERQAETDRLARIERDYQGRQTELDRMSQTERALQDGVRVAPAQAGQQNTRTETRTENIDRYEVDWGTPPPGTTVRNRQGLVAGDMP